MIMKKIAAAVLSGLLIFSTITISAEAYTEKQEELHLQAEELRSNGYLEGSEEIAELQKQWWYEENDIEIITTVIAMEAGYCSDRHQELVGAVIVNRKNSKVWPNSVYEVVSQPGQYRQSYATVGSSYWNKARDNRELYLRCRSAAERALNGVDCPGTVMYQANFRQGSGVYEVSKVDTGYFSSTTYFCYR